MTITLSPETQKLLEQQMKRYGSESPDLVVRIALEKLDGDQVEFIEDLDPQTQAAIDEALAQAERGEGRPWPEVKEELRARFIGD